MHALTVNWRLELGHVILVFDIEDYMPIRPSLVVVV